MCTPCVCANDFKAHGWFRNGQNGHGLYNECRDAHFYAASDNYWHINPKQGQTTGALIFYQSLNQSGGSATGRRGYVYFDGTNNFGLLSCAGSWAVKIAGDSILQLCKPTCIPTHLSVSGADDYHGIAIGQAYSNNGSWDTQLNMYGTDHVMVRWCKSAGDAADNAQYGCIWLHNSHPLTMTSSGNMRICAAGTVKLCLTSTLTCVTGCLGITSIANQARTVPTKFFASNDNFVRYHDRCHFKGLLGLTSKYQCSRTEITASTAYWTGSMGWAAQCFNTVGTWGSGFFDVWSNPGQQPSGTSHWVGTQALHYSASETATYGWQMAVGAGSPALTFMRGNWGSGWGSWYKMWNAANLTDPVNQCRDIICATNYLQATNYVYAAGSRLGSSNLFCGATCIHADADSKITFKNAGTNAIAMYADAGDELYLASNNAASGTVRIPSAGGIDASSGCVTAPIVCANATSGYALRTNGCIYANNSIVSAGNLYGVLTCGTTCVETPVVCATTAVKAPIFCGTTCGDLQLGSYVGSVKWPHCTAQSSSRTFQLASNQGVWGNLVLAMSDANDAPTDCKMIDIRNNLITVCKTLCATTCIKTPIVCATTHFTGPLFCGNIAAPSTALNRFCTQHGSPGNIQIHYPSSTVTQNAWTIIGSSEPGWTYNGTFIGNNICSNGAYYGVECAGAGAGVAIRMTSGCFEVAHYPAFNGTGCGACRKVMFAGCAGESCMNYDGSGRVIATSWGACTVGMACATACVRACRGEFGGNNHQIEAAQAVIRMYNSTDNHNYIVSNSSGWQSWQQWIRYTGSVNTWRIGTYDEACTTGNSLWRLAGKARSGNSEINYIVAGPRTGSGTDRVIFYCPHARTGTDWTGGTGSFPIGAGGIVCGPTCVHSPIAKIGSTTVCQHGGVGRLKFCGSGDNNMAFGPHDDNGWGYIESTNNSHGIYFGTNQGGFSFDTGHLKSYNDGEVDVGVTGGRFRCGHFSSRITSVIVCGSTCVHAGTVCSTQIYSGNWFRNNASGAGLYNQCYWSTFLF